MAVTNSTDTKQVIWHKALEHDELADGRVKTVTVGVKTLCMTHYAGQHAAMDNHCPHQGGPLGEGSIENGLLRCPWHGWDYCPLTGNAPGFDDGVETFPTEVRGDGIYVAIEVEPQHIRTVSDIIIETMVNWGVRSVFGMVGHSNLGVADAIRLQEESGHLRYIGVRHEPWQGSPANIRSRSRLPRRPIHRQETIEPIK